MQIIDKYFFKAYIKSFLGALILLLGIGLIAKVNETLKYVGAYEGPRIDIVMLYVHSVPSFMTYVVPPAMLFAIAFTMSGFINSNEAMVLLAAGRPYYRIVMPMVVFSIFFAGLFFLINEYIAYPGAYKAYEDVSKLRGRSEGWRYGSANFKNVALIYRNRYYTLGRILVVKNQVDGFHLLLMSPSGKPARILDAERAFIENKRYNLIEVSETLFGEDGEFLKRVTHKSLSIDLPETLEDLVGGIQTTTSDERNIFEIAKLIENRKKTGASISSYLTEYYWHISYPLICFFLTFIGGMLGSTGGRIGNRHSKGSVAGSIGLAMTFTIGYFFIMYFGTALGDSETLAPFLAANLANFISAGFAVYVFKKSDT